MNVTIRSNRNNQDGVSGRGLFFLNSKSQSVESATLNFTGVISVLAPALTQTNLLTPIKLEYSQGIKGAKELWVSASSSRIQVEVDLDEVLAGGSGGEGFGEIKLKDALTGELMAIVPVTVLDDKSGIEFHRSRLKVGSQGSARLHFDVPPGLKALRIRTRVIEGSSNGLLVSTFDSHRVRTQQLSLTDEIWLPITRPGHHQVALSMNGGTGREAVVDFEVEPINLELRTQTAHALKPKIKINYAGESSLFTIIELVPLSETLVSTMSEIGSEVKALEQTVKLNSKIDIAVKLEPLDESDVAFFYANCTGKVIDLEGKETLIRDTYSSPDEKERTVTFRCIPFDQGISSGHKLGWSMKIFKSNSATAQNTLGFSPRSLREVEFSEQKTGVYEVRSRNILTNQIVKLGLVDLIVSNQL
jgi:hypothetical protein